MAVPRPTRSLEMLSAITRSAPSARATLTGTGLTIAPSNSQRPLIFTGSNTPGKRIGGADRVDQQAAPQPDLVPAADLGGDAGEPNRQILDAKPAKLGLEPRAQPLAADEAAAGEGEIEEAEHAAAGQGPGECLEHVEPARGVAAADQRADRRADDDIEPQAHRVEFPQRADMGPAARRARAKHDPDFRRRRDRPPPDAGSVSFLR